MSKLGQAPGEDQSGRRLFSRADKGGVQMGTSCGEGGNVSAAAPGPRRPRTGSMVTQAETEPHIAGGFRYPAQRRT